jgi:glycosyltransferase involved in cell wall biosynthesis
MATISIIIPAFNEEDGIGPVLDDLKRVASFHEIIVVDDGSDDKTGSIARDRGARVVRHPACMGYGRSLKDGIRAATGDIIVITDADGTYPVDRIPDLVQRVEGGFALAVGARQGPAYRGSFWKMPARSVFKLIVEFATGKRIPDVNSGLRAFDRATILRYIDDLCEGFSFTTTQTLAYHLTWQPVCYIDIDYHKRIGRSKVRIVRDSLRTLQYITEAIAHYNPLKLFVLLSAMAGVLGLLGAFVAGWMSVLTGAWVALLIFALGIVAETRRTRACGRQ